MRTLPVTTSGEFYGAFPGFAASDTISVSGRAKIEFQNYRFRGKFRVRREGDQARVDFTHSSLLGAVQAEGSLFLNSDGMALFDEKEGVFYVNDTCEQMVEEAVGAKVTAEEIMLALQIDYPDYDELKALRSAVGGSSWSLECRWGETGLNLSGKEKGRVDLMEIGRAGAQPAFSIRYGYGAFGWRYPERIVISGDNEEARIDLKVENFSGWSNKK